MARGEMEKIKVDMTVESVHISAMAEMSDEQYRSFLLDEGLFMIDHHDILRSSAAGYPMATNKTQLDILLTVLSSMGSSLN